MKKTTIFLFIITISIFKSELFGQDYTGADSGAEFLKFGIGARVSAMGESYDSKESDIFSTYWNPAGVAGLNSINAGFMHSDALPGASLEYLGVGMPLLSGGIAVSVHLMLYEEEPVIDKEGGELGDLFWQERAFSLYYGRSLTENLDWGLGIKLVQKVFDGPGFDTVTGDAFALDGGIIYRAPQIPGLSVGGGIVNAGQKIKMGDQPKADDLPRSLRVGGSYKYESFIFSADLSKVLEDSWRPGAGIEYTVAPGFFLRGGYYSRSGNLGGFTFGVGAISGNFNLDWASLPAGEMGEISRENRISLKFIF